MSSMKGLESTENELVLLQGSDTGSEVDLYDVSLSPTSAPCDEKGKLYTVTFEVWVSDGNSSTLESIAKSVQHAIESHRVQSFKLWEELLRDDNLRSFPAGLRSIKAVEYTGEDKFDNQTICTKKGQLTVKVFAFKMNIDTEFNANNDSPGQLRLLPDRDLQAVWEGWVPTEMAR
ncbi:MAG: hypothetical protein M1818_001222 [Claussenomyces sp. TS43310]|nr:MAG: hypothetical protein M1818_001222 [Claussenomyces sp. TS43310]